MTLEKSIEINTQIKNMKTSVLLPSSQTAIKLGIEALKFIQLARHYHWAGSEKLLPGETNLPSPKL